MHKVKSIRHSVRSTRRNYNRVDSGRSRCDLMLILQSMPDTPSSLESLNKAISDFLESLQPLLRFVAFASIPGSAEAFSQAFEDWKLYFLEQYKALLSFLIKHLLLAVEHH